MDTARHQRQAEAGSPSDGRDEGDREGGGGPAPGGGSQGSLARHSPRPKRRADHRRPRPFAVSGLEPALERRQVHERGRPRRGQFGTSIPVRSNNRPRHGTGHHTRISALRARPLSAGRDVGRPARRRPRAGTLAGATTGREHGGGAAAESEGEGKGATFTVKLPVRAVYTAETEGTPASGQRKSLAG